MDIYVGTILPIAFNWAPVDFVVCDGRLLSTSQYAALFSLIGYQYGGSGASFAVPDLRGRTVIGYGQGTGLPYNAQFAKPIGNATATIGINQMASATLTAANLPSHSHSITVNSSGLTATSTLMATQNGPGQQAPAAGAMLGNSGAGPGAASIYYTGDPAPTVALNAKSVTTQIGGAVSAAVGSTGTGAPVQFPVQATAQSSLLQPGLGMNYVICVNGLYPERPS